MGLKETMSKLEHEDEPDGKFEVKVFVNGHEIILVENGESKSYHKFKAEGDIIANVYVKRGWKRPE